MSTNRHLSFAAAAALLLPAGTAAAEFPERETATSASGFAALAGIEAEPLGPTEMDEVQGRTDLMTVATQLEEMNQQFNVQYLMLQQKMQGENRQFTALSNVLKTKHDTAKNALNNLK